MGVPRGLVGWGWGWRYGGMRGDHWLTDMLWEADGLPEFSELYGWAILPVSFLNYQEYFDDQEYLNYQDYFNHQELDALSSPSDIRQTIRHEFRGFLKIQTQTSRIFNLFKRISWLFLN